MNPHVIQIDPDILSGTGAPAAPVFAGTRVPVATLFAHLEQGIPLEAFLEDFPTAPRRPCHGTKPSKYSNSPKNWFLPRTLCRGMRVLLATVATDENLPKRLKQDFPDHEVYTVRERGWNGKKNGELMQLLLAEGFQVLMTFDKNLSYQQNFSRYPLTVLVLNAPDNTYLTLQQLVPSLTQTLAHPLPPGAHVISLPA
ncbi:Protein of unknown function [Catalinimonas alkaloidigena]|uniref:DUF5615 domain-containing protein n=1 Tax=Catalinimonas alkaloidigena TaxID=1075417 RepID=A0A1G9UZ33_9BACT|nr:DUF433 domain-containing protein [Catalinimonas alkaloidigena]SDM65123.1 Protein of unknown function [Catalinimonas alkaloidigena]